MSIARNDLASVLNRMDFGRALKAELLMTGKGDAWVPYAQPLLDAVSLFDELGVRYALIGGIAAMYYGRARFTEDVDFVAAAGHAEILSAHPDVLEHHHFASDCAHKLYHRSGVPVDLWNDEHAQGIISRSVEVDLIGRKIRMIEAHDLIAMKLRARRLKDDYDISQILLNMPIDLDQMRKLSSADELEHLEVVRSRS